jgi:hypothetical protein
MTTIMSDDKRQQYNLSSLRLRQWRREMAAIYLVAGEESDGS